MNIEEVLQIKEQMLGDYTVQAVDGRALHEALGIKTKFRDWMKRKLQDVGGVEGEDYQIDARPNLSGGGYAQDYILKLSIAKDIAMMSKGDSAQTVRDYFKACEKTVQTQVQQISASDSVLIDFRKDIEYANWFATNLHLKVGKVQKYAIEKGTQIEQKTGVKVLIPQLLQDAGLQIDYDSPDGTLAHAAKVAIGTVFTNVSKWAKDMYGKPAYSTLINNTLIELGFAIRMKNLKMYATTLGAEYSNSTTIAHSGHNNLTNVASVTGWNLNDKRFTDVVFPVIAHKISIGKKK